jgi:hypothetical protein
MYLCKAQDSKKQAVMIGTRATELWQQVNIELNLQFTASNLRATTAIFRGTSLLLRAMHVTPLTGLCGAQQRRWICARERLAAREGMEKL